MGADNFTLPTLTFNKNSKNPFEDNFKRAVLNLADVEFAAAGGATFVPLLLKLVKDFLDGKEYNTPFDFAILTQIQSGGVLSLPTIKSYIAAAGEDFNFYSCTRADLFETFCACLVSSKFNPSYAAPDEILRLNLRAGCRVLTPSYYKKNFFSAVAGAFFISRRTRTNRF